MNIFFCSVTCFVKKLSYILLNRRLQFEKTYFVETFGMDLFRESVWKGIISRKR